MRPLKPARKGRTELGGTCRIAWVPGLRARRNFCRGTLGIDWAQLGSGREPVPGSPFSQNEFEALLADQSKSISCDIAWVDDEDHSPAVEFRAAIENQQGRPLFVRGSYNRLARTLTFAVIHQGVGRIYALDMGKAHLNPDRSLVGDLHKHRWTDEHRDAQAYVPNDITASVGDPVAVWHQFCAEAGIKHNGVLRPVPPLQENLL